MPDKPNTANQKLNNALIKSKLDEQRRESEKIEQRIKEEEKSEPPLQQ